MIIKRRILQACRLMASVNQIAPSLRFIAWLFDRCEDEE
jgi:hypothetical protein